jgi:hypothetical protein
MKTDTTPRRNQAHTAIIPALQRLKQEELEFEASLGYIVSETLSQKKTKANKKNS